MLNWSLLFENGLKTKRVAKRLGEGSRARPCPHPARSLSAQRREPSLPLRFPSHGKWLVQLRARKGRFAFGLYRCDMKVIGYQLGRHGRHDVRVERQERRAEGALITRRRSRKPRFRAR